MNRFPAFSSLAQLDPREVDDAERDGALWRDVHHEFGADLHGNYGPWVLAHHFGWSERAIALWQNDWMEGDIEEERLETEELHTLWLINEARLAKESDPNFEATENASLVYLYFHFLVFEPEYRPLALTQTEQVRALCAPQFFAGLLSHLGWSLHEVLAMVAGE